MGYQLNSDRRRFIQQLGGTFAAGSLSSLLPQLALMPSAMAQVGGSYRALVCVYLSGANDSFNWLVPRDADISGSAYDRYRTARGGVYGPGNTSGLAHAFTDLLPIAPTNQASAYGLHPACTDFTLGAQVTKGLQTLFTENKAAFVCNAGTLLQPITKTEYDAGAPRPTQLFSHNDQALQWQMGIADPNAPLSRYGWGGRVAKQLGVLPLTNGLSPTISIAGSTRFLIGDQIMPYQIASSGVNLIDNYATSGANFSAARRAVLNDLLDDSYNHPFTREYARTVSRSLSVGENLYALLNAADGSGNVTTIFPTGNSLADQLKMVARMIKVSRNSLSATRQVYFVNYGSFDLHNGMFAAGQPVATSGHGALLTALNQALGSFWASLGEIVAQDQVTTFTMSDFARTLTGNGDGSDHAWGGNMLVLGDRVDGGKLFGKYPQLIVNNNDNVGTDWSFSRGQYIPTTAVEQIASTLSRWMGVTDSTVLGALFPNLNQFASNDLGFMKPG
jgi:uncharacterized protein (DUF1501 family)